MMKHFIAALGLVVVTLAAYAAPQTIQITHGSCSPAVSNVTGNVTITCQDVSPEALEQINNIFATKFKQLTDRLRETEEWVGQLKGLEARLVAISNPVDQEKKAAVLLQQGRLEEAGQNLDEILVREDEMLQRLAGTHFNRAKVYTLQFYPVKALPHYRKAYEYEPENMEYALALAKALSSEREYTEAQQLFRLALDTTESKNGKYDVADLRIRAEAFKGLAKIARDAKVSDDKGGFQALQLRMDEYVRYQEQAVSIYRQLNERTAGAHTFELATAINELAGGILTRDVLSVTNMVDLSLEAADLFERLAKEHPEKETYYLAYSMGALTGLAVAQNISVHGMDMDAKTQHTKTLNRMISLHERIRSKNAEYLTVEVAGSYFMIATTYITKGEFTKAEEATTMAIEILEKRSKLGDEFYQSLPALYHLQSLMLLHNNKGDKALESSKKAVQIARQLVERSPRQFEQLLVTSLEELAKTQRELKQYDAAAITETEQRQIKDKLGLKKKITTTTPATAKPKSETSSKEAVHAFHILVNNKEKAAQIIAQLKQSNNLENDFKKAAKQHSTGPSSNTGGDLKWFKRNVMVKEFENAAFAMQPGEITDEPVKTVYGWHVIFVKDRK